MPKLFSTILTILLSLAVQAQDNYRFISYGEDSGLPQSSIYDIGQDKDGFIWIGTAGGLCRFDGYQMKVYKQSAQNPKAISSYKEFRFYTDSEKRMWIVSFNGISLYNSLTDDFTNVLVYAPKNVVIAENRFFGEDKDFIWVGLCNYGIVKVNKHTLKVLNTSLTRTTSRSSNNVGYHGFLENGKLWIIDNNESSFPVFSIYDVNANKADTIPLKITNIINLNDSQALGLTYNSALLINKQTFAYKTIAVAENGKDHNVVSMYKSSGSEVVLSSSTQGLYYIDFQKGKLTKHIFYTDPENKKNNLYARCVMNDRSGNTWIGTRGEGVFKLSHPYKKFAWYRSEFSGTNNVFGLYADNTDLYVGLMSSGMTKFSRNGNGSSNIVLNKNIRYALNNAYAISSLDKDNLLILVNSTVNNGYSLPCIYTKSTGKIELMNGDVQKTFSENWGRGNLRHFIFKDKEGNLLTGIGDYLVSISSCAGNRYCTRLLHRFTDETLTTGFTDRDGKIWVGSFTSVFKQEGDRWKRINLPKNKEVKSMSQDPDGNMWLGSNDDIVVINSEGKVINHFTEDNGLVNGHVYSILKDDDGNMWFSHNKGLSVYHWKEKTLEHLNKEDGLQSSEFNVGSSFKADDGEIFFGGINGVTGFYPSQIARNPNAPAVKITGIKIYDEPYKSDIAYWNIKKLTLPYTENSISFEYALPEYTNQSRNRYSFMMEGVDDKWIDGGDRRFTRYPALSPGHYTFRVRGINNDGVVSAETSSIEINIIPPFWQRSWFITVVTLVFILLSVGAGIMIQKLRQRKAIQALELQHKIQLERERISRDLHDNVGTQLSLISKNIEGVIDPLQNATDAERIRNLGNISQTSREVIFTLRETIWALNKEKISLEELSDKLKAFTQKLFEFNPASRLVFSEEIKEDVILSPTEAIHLFRICQEAITNSLKYAEASLMHITMRAENGKYHISIVDDGIGFKENTKEKELHYGLQNMQHRAGEIDCSFLIESKPGEGTTVTIDKK
jgi:signal transduction histidine kinase/ligand-binding sensor domain-containing protein